jgi:hypothetical protein
VSNYYKPLACRDTTFGLQVTYSWTLPASATTNTLFTVSGGNILVLALLGQVTTAIGSTTTTLALGAAPTTGTAEHTGIATAAAITSCEAGVWLTPGVSTVSSNIIAPAELSVGSFAGFTPSIAAMAFPAAIGGITATTSANAGGGVISWYLMYVPLDSAATVVAA